MRDSNSRSMVGRERCLLMPQILSRADSIAVAEKIAGYRSPRSGTCNIEGSLPPLISPEVAPIMSDIALV